MIVNKEVNPEREIYHLGALVIDILKKEKTDSFKIFDVFELLNLKLEVSFNLFVQALDWLFILGLIDERKGRLIKCF